MTLAQFRLTKVAFLACYICLFSLSPWALAATNEKSISAHDSPVTASPFDATGLTARPGETAEEILLRAHGYDPGAVAMTITGYAKGIGGFPKSSLLASGWAYTASDMGMRSTSIFAELAIDRPLDWRSARECADALQSPFVSAFKQANILDVAAVCIPSLPAKPKDPGFYARRGEANLTNGRTITLLRKAAAGKANAEECEELPRNFSAEHAKPILFFYAATTHDWERETPDWQPERLISFIQKSTCPQWEKTAETFLLQHFSADKPSALELFRKAHNGDPAAMRIMAINYYTGGQNFPNARFLAEMWIFFGAMQGDSGSMELKAVLETGGRSTAKEAGMWMDAAARFGDESTRATAEAYIRALETPDQSLTEAIMREAGSKLAQHIRDVMAESGQQHNTTVPDRDTENP